MTVKELIEILSKVDGNTKVKCTWEGQCPDIHGIYVEDDVLYLDSDGCFYAPDELLYKHKSVYKNGNCWSKKWKVED